MAKERTPTKVVTHYQTLQIEPDAHTEIIDVSFRRLAKKYHPDYNPTSTAMGKMQDLNGAYSILRNRESRRTYNATLAEQATHSTNRLSDRSRNTAFLICLAILAGLLFQFFNPSTRTIADSNESSIARDLDDMDISSDAQLSLEMKAVSASTSPYLSKATLLAAQLESVHADDATAESAQESHNAAEPEDASHEESAPTSNDAATARVVVDIIPAEPTQANRAATATPTPTVKLKLSLRPVTAEPEVMVAPKVTVAPKDAATKKSQEPIQIAATSTAFPTPHPTQLSVQSISVPETAPTAAPIVQAAVQPDPGSQPIMVQQASIHSIPPSLHGQIGSIHLIAPTDGINGRKLQTFLWSADFVPGPNQGFELIFWQPEQDPLTTGFGLAASTTDTSITINLDELDVTLGTLLDWGHYRWGVLLVEQEPYRRIALLGSNGNPESRAFLFTNYKSAERLAEQQSTSAQGAP